MVIITPSFIKHTSSCHSREGASLTHRRVASCSEPGSSFHHYWLAFLVPICLSSTAIVGECWLDFRRSFSWYFLSVPLLVLPPLTQITACTVAQRAKYTVSLLFVIFWKFFYFLICSFNRKSASLRKTSSAFLFVTTWRIWCRSLSLSKVFLVSMWKPPAMYSWPHWASLWKATIIKHQSRFSLFLLFCEQEELACVSGVNSRARHWLLWSADGGKRPSGSSGSRPSRLGRAG